MATSDEERSEGLGKSSFESKVKEASLKDKIVAMKLFNPKLKAKEIAHQLGSTKNYVWKTWSEFVRKEVSSSERANNFSPLVPFHVHGWFYYNQVPASWYVRCPYGLVDNRNRLKLCRTRLYTFCIYPSGSVFVYPFFRELTGWKDLLRQELGKWLLDDEIQVFIDSLSVIGQKSMAAHTPNVPRNYNFHVKGLGKFKTDTTPWNDGTTEFEVDVGYEKRLSTIEGNMDKVGRAVSDLAEAIKQQAESMQPFYDAVEKFGVDIEKHLELINALKAESEKRSAETSALIQALTKAVEELSKLGYKRKSAQRYKRKGVKRYEPKAEKKPRKKRGRKEREGLLGGMKSWWNKGYE